VEPDPVAAAVLAELGGADGITIHLREDRRHIQDHDLELLRKTVQTHLNLEMALNEEIVQIALRVLPDQATLVPEKREEVTTEGGLDVLTHRDNLKAVVKRLKDAGIRVSLFVDPVVEIMRVSKQVGADAVELHTGSYANARTEEEVEKELAKLKEAARVAGEAGLAVFAGHGLNYINIFAIKTIPQLMEVNIGHSIVSRAVFVGIKKAVREMKDLLSE